MDALKAIKKYSEKAGVREIGNISVKDMDVHGFSDFIKMKQEELKFLREGKTPVSNIDITVAFGKERDNDISKAIRAGQMDSPPPVSVQTVESS